jgi:hypothetical protein
MTRQDVLKRLVPVPPRTEVRAAAGEGAALRAWLNFAQCQKSPAVMAAIKARAQGRCAVCGETHGVMVGHHVNYRWRCVHDTEQPDCGGCAERTPDAFRACTQRLVPVHQICHLRIHAQEAGRTIPLPDTPSQRTPKDFLLRQVDGIARRLMADGPPPERQSLVAAFVAAGLKIGRDSPDYLSVADHTGQRVRLRVGGHSWLTRA